MSEILFWMAKPIAEFLLVVVLFFVLTLIYFLCRIPRIIRQARCIHESYWVPRSCDAVCRSCGKNLGFIGALKLKSGRDRE